VRQATAAGRSRCQQNKSCESFVYTHALLHFFCCWLALCGTFHSCQCLAWLMIGITGNHALIMHELWYLALKLRQALGDLLKRSCVDHLIIVTIICVLCVQDDMTPLHNACDQGRTECAELLLQAGARANKADEVNHDLQTGAPSLFCWWLALSSTFHQCQCLAYKRHYRQILLHHA